MVIQDGKLDQQELADLRYSVDDLMEQLRINGIFDLREVDYAVAETTGQLSIRKKAQYETLNAQTLQIQLTPQPVPVLVINDRKILDQGLKTCGLTEGAFKKILKKEGYRSEDIFPMRRIPAAGLLYCTDEQTIKGGTVLKRIYAAIAFLLVIVSTSLFTIKQCYDFRSRALPELEQLTAYAQNQQLDQAAEVAAQFFDQWSQTKDSMVWYIRHEPLEKITDISARLEQLARYGDLSQLLAQTKELGIRVDELYRNELPLLRNLV